MRGNEVFEYAQALTQRRLDRQFDGFTRRVCDQTFHTAQLRYLRHTTTRTGVCHHPDRVELVKSLLQFDVDVLDSLLPYLYGLVVSVFFAQTSFLELLFDRNYVLVSLSDDFLFLGRNVHIEYARGNCADRRILVTLSLNLVEDYGSLGCALVLKASVNYLGEHLLVDNCVDFEVELLFGGISGHKVQILRDCAVEDNASDSRMEFLGVLDSVDNLFNSDEYFGLERYLSVLISHHSFFGISEVSAFALAALSLDGEIVRTDDHILRRRYDRLTVAQLEDIVGREHQESRFRSCLYGKRYVHSHLVTVKVCVKRGTYERVQLDSSAFYEYGLECLNGKSVQGRSTVEEYGVVLDNLFEDIPNRIVLRSFDNFLCALDIEASTFLYELFHYERLEELDSHFLRNTALVHLEFRTYDDNRTTGIVDTLTEQVLTETTLLTFEESCQRFEFSVACARNGFTSSAVVNQSVYGVLKHSLFVADDYFGRAHFDELFKSVVSVDNSTIQIVKVGRSISSAVEGNHRSEFGRKYGKHVENHPLGTSVAESESFDDIETLYSLDSLLIVGFVRALCYDSLKIRSFFFEVDLAEQFFDCFRAHTYSVRAEVLGNNHAFGVLAHILVSLFDSLFVVLVDYYVLFLEFGITGVEHDKLIEVQYRVNVLGRHIEYYAYSGRHALIVPNMRYGSSQLDVTHSLTSYLGFGNFYTALVAYNALISDALILTAVTFPVLGRSEYFFAEQAVLFGLLSSVIDCF